MSGSPTRRMPSIDFLIRWDPTGPWALTAIKPDGPIITTSFYPDEEFDAARWITHQSADGRNLYFHVNRPTRVLTKKASKSDIAYALALHTDIDPSPTLTRPQILFSLLSHTPPPNIIIDSGNGYQAYWRIPPDRDLRAAEGSSRHIQSLLPGADQVHSIDHIMRLPGTANYPSAKKRAQGRTITQSSVHSANWTILHDLARFPRAPEPDDPANTPQTTSWPAHLPAEDLANPACQPHLDDGLGAPSLMTEEEAATATIIAAISRVANTTENRNNKLAQEAFLCGTRLAASGLTEDYIHKRLFDSIPGLDRNHRKDSDTIRRQLREGQRHPETNDPRIRELHTMAHRLLDLTPPLTLITYQKTLHHLNLSRLDPPLPHPAVDKIATRAREVHKDAE